MQGGPPRRDPRPPSTPDRVSRGRVRGMPGGDVSPEAAGQPSRPGQRPPNSRGAVTGHGKVFARPAGLPR